MHKTAVGAFAPFLLAITALAQTAPKQATQTTPPPMPTATKPGQPPPPAHPLTTAQAHELMQLTGTDQIKTRLNDNVAANMQRFPPFVPQDVKDDVRTSMEKLDLDTPTVAIYQRYLSTDDAAKAIEFYKTPAGKNVVQATPMLMGDIQQMAGKQGQETFQAAIQRHRPEIEAAQKTYEAQHASPGPSLGPPTPGSGPAAARPGSSPGSSSPGSAPKKPQ